MSHSPGPFRYELDRKRNRFNIIDAQNQIVATVVGTPGHFEANAALLAAAPDLLRLVKAQGVGEANIRGDVIVGAIDVTKIDSAVSFHQAAVAEAKALAPRGVSTWRTWIVGLGRHRHILRRALPYVLVGGAAVAVMPVARLIRSSANTSAPIRARLAKVLGLGTIGWWTFDEGSGALVRDTSGKGKDGVWHGTSVHAAPGKVGLGAGRFNGLDDYVEIGNIRLADEISVTAWVNSPTFSRNGFVIVKNPVNTQWGLFFELGALKWRAGGPCVPELSAANPSSGLWHHIAATQHGRAATLYVDGVAVATSRNCPAIGDGEGIVEIGRYDNGYYFSGLIDDVHLYRRALAADEISTLFHAVK
jgi:hypothetical protein